MFKARLISFIRRSTRFLPDRLRLSALTWLDVRLRSAEPENIHIPRLAAAAMGRSVAIDVGANNGVTTCLMARSFPVVHAFEANPRLAGDLVRCAPDGVRVWPVALSSEAGEATLTIPISSGVTLEGWGSIEAPLLAGVDKFERVTVKTQSLDSCAFEDVGFIKIDVEGHEMAVLAGARATIERCRPWLVVEALDDHQEKVRAFLAPFGYRETTLQALVGVPGSPHNLVFLPPAPPSPP